MAPDRAERLPSGESLWLIIHGLEPMLIHGKTLKLADSKLSLPPTLKTSSYYNEGLQSKIERGNEVADPG
jgi:hypothetical protein